MEVRRCKLSNLPKRILRTSEHPALKPGWREKLRIPIPHPPLHLMEEIPERKCMARVPIRLLVTGVP